MKHKYQLLQLTTLSALVLGSFSNTSNAVEVYAGTGIGYGNSATPWVANIVFGKTDKKSLTAGLTATFKTGDNLTPTCSEGTAGCAQNQTGIAALTAPKTSSIAWCDPDAKPQNTGGNGNYTVTASFDEPSYSDRDSVFSGSFAWDPDSHQLTSFTGKMNQVMVSAAQTLKLDYLKDWAYDAVNQTVTASVFKNDTTAIYKSPDTFNSVSDMPLTDGTANAYFTLTFDATDPTANTSGFINKMIYGDCVPGSLMAKMCMTGLQRGGTMGGVPLSLSITRNATQSAVAAAVPDFSTCYGSALDSKWVVIDLNGLKSAGLGNVWIKVTAKRYDNEGDNVTDADDDLVPALTVFRGRQDVGAHGPWYPNQFQQMPFWAWKLSPFHTTEKKTDTTGGFQSAYGSADETTVSVLGQYVLRGGNQNYLTIAVGGDSKDLTNPKHDANFELSVSAYRKNPDMVKKP